MKSQAVRRLDKMVSIKAGWIAINVLFQNNVWLWRFYPPPEQARQIWETHAQRMNTIPSFWQKNLS